MTEVKLSFEEWIGLADGYLTASLRGKPIRHHDMKSANWGFQSQLADVRLMPSGGLVPRFLWHEGELPGMRIGELADGLELGLQQNDAKRFADLATRFFYGDRTFIRTLPSGKRA